MGLGLLVLWTCVVSLTAVGGAYYVKKYQKPDALIAFYALLVVTANLTASKIIGFDLGFTTLFADAATLIFAVTFLITDVVNERFGRAETQRMIVIAVFAQIAFLIFTYMAIKAIPAPFWTGQEAFAAVLGAVPRIAIASIITFLVSEMLDAYIYQWFRSWTAGKHLWMRNAFSSLPSMLVDSVLFTTLAFYGTLPLMPLIIGLTAIKWIVGIIDIPFMYLSRYIMRTQ